MSEPIDFDAARMPRSTLFFLALVFGTTWLFQLPWLLATRGLLAGPPGRFMPLVVLGFFGPLFVALLLAALEGREQFRALWRDFANWRSKPAYYLLALALPCAVFLVMRALFAAVGGGGSDLGPWFYPPVQAQQIAALLLIPFTEQIPWRGYLYPRLERLFGSKRASLLTGCAWGLFHVQKHAFIDPNASLPFAVLTLVMMTTGTVVFSWFYQRGDRSMWLVIVAHMGSYLNNPATAFPNLLPLTMLTLGYSLIALTLLVRRHALEPSEAEYPNQANPPRALG